MSSDRRQNLFVLLLFLGLSLAVYWDCLFVLIPGDNYTQFLAFDQGFVKGFLESARGASAYFSGLPFLYLLYKLFGQSALAWNMTSILLHCFNAFLVYLLARQLAVTFLKNKNAILSVIPAMIFLLSPYQAETVLWGTVSARWLFHTGFLLISFYYLLHYLDKPSGRSLLFIHLSFIAALTSNETAYAAPLAYLVLFALHRITGKTTVTTKDFLLKLMLPQAIIIFSVLLFTKLILGSWLWHGGSFIEISASGNPLAAIVKYQAKFFLFYRYLPFQEFNEWFGKVVHSRIFLITALAIFILVISFVIRSLLKRNRNGGVMLLAIFLVYLTFLVPVMHLDSCFLTTYYPDRYGYVASAFFSLFLAFLLVTIHKKTLVPFGTIWILASWYFLSATTGRWKESDEHCKKLMDSFEPYHSIENIYVLNEPTYYHGVVSFRSGFSAFAQYRYGPSLNDRIRTVSGCYQENDTLSGVHFTGDTIHVTGPKKPAPYFRTGGWPFSYENEEFIVLFSHDGCSYQLIFRNGIPENSVFLYACKEEWKKAG